MEFGSCKAKLGKILEKSLANKRAAKDLEGIVGIKGSFTYAATGDAVSDVVGTGFAVIPSATDGAFYVDLDVMPKNILGVKAMAFTTKALDASSDSFTVDVASVDLSGAKARITFRIVDKASTYDVMVPGDDCTVFFEINCTYSKETGY